MDGGVTRLADDQRLTLACCHQLDPQGSLSLPFPLQVLEGSHMMDLDVLL
jgi:hypothetical protein